MPVKNAPQMTSLMKEAIATIRSEAKKYARPAMYVNPAAEGRNVKTYFSPQKGRAVFNKLIANEKFNGLEIGWEPYKTIHGEQAVRFLLRQ